MIVINSFISPLKLIVLWLGLVRCAPWTELRPPAGSDDGAQFGTAVTVNTDFLAVGAFQDHNGTGTVSIYDRSASLITTLFPQGLTPGAQFGCALASQPGLLAVGAQNDASDQSGAIYVFAVSQSKKVQLTTRLRPTSPVPSGYFGSSIGFSGRALITGAPAGSGSGVAHLFFRSPKGWTWSKPHTIASPAVLKAGDNFGQSVAVHSSDQSPAFIAIGANHAHNTSGSVFIYESEQDGSPKLLDELRAPDAIPSDYFGSQVAVAELWSKTRIRVVAVGAAFRDNGRGGVYVFFHTANGAWQSKQLGPENSKAGGFGSSIALSVNGDDTVVTLTVGAWQEDGKGASYTYALSAAEDGLTIKFQARLQPDVLEEGAFFGSSMSSLMNGVLIGADGFHNSDGAAFLFES